MSAQARVLIIDDEPQIRKFLRISLGAQGYDVIEAANGQSGIEKCALDSPDLVILDLGLPDMDGQEVLAKIREWSDVPVIVLSVRSNEEEKVTALDHGANDYVTKPFGIAELIARVRVVLRNRKSEDVTGSEIVSGKLRIDLAAHKVFLVGEELKLTKKEFALLTLLARNAGRIITHQLILREIWGPAQEHETHYLRIYIGHLRQKLGDDPLNPKYIENEPGVGYRFRRFEDQDMNSIAL
ncbi:MAG: response regulator transcription factor [Pseudomonadota bacterium]